MPYTLAKFFLWGLLLALAGGVVGWLLRSLLCRREVAAARAGTVDDAELERLQHRLANVEPAVGERDRLRAELDTTRQELVEARSAARAGAAAGGAGIAGGAAMGFASLGDGGSEGETAAPEAVEPLDLDAAAAAIGSKIKLDDLTVVEGIGPKIAELCNGIGIHAWRDLADTEASLLRTMLTDAGSRFQMHDPTTWPQQAGLLASGQWAEFKTLTDELDGGR